MTNLTGQYDVAAEIGLPLLNRIVAAMHANQDPRYPSFPHRIAMWLDDTPRGPADPVPAADRTGVRTRVEIQVSTPTLGFPLSGVFEGGVLEVLAASRPRSRSGGAPASTARIAPDVLGDWGDRLEGDLYLPPRYPKVTARVRLRAWVRDSPEPALPEFIDGDLTVQVGLSRADVPGGSTFLTLERGDSLAVGFRPAPGTTVSDEERSLIERLVRNVIRSESAPPTFEVSLPADVRHFNFRLQPTAPTPSAAAMFVLGNRPAPSTPAGVAQGFLPPGADLAVAVGRDYLGSLLRAQLLSGQPSRYTFSGGWGAISGAISPDWANASFDLQWGRAVLTIGGSGHVTVVGAVTDNFSFTVRLGFGLVVVDGIPEPVADGDPELDFSGLTVEIGLVTDQARARLKQARDQALAAGRAELRRALDVRRVFQEILQGLLPVPPAVTLTTVAIQPDGVVVGARVERSDTGPVVVTYVSRDGKLNALDSWIPGGTIERFVWERLRRGSSGSGRVEEHRFVTEGLGGPIESALFTTCLRVEGTRVEAGGPVPVIASRCTQLVLSLPPWRAMETGEGRPLLPITSLDANGRARVSGHYDPWATGVTPSNGGTCLLVHFVGGEWAKAEPELREALKARKKQGALIVLGVLPAGADPVGEEGLDGAPLVVAADDEGRWARAYEATTAPATVLVGPRGDVVWREDGPIVPAKLAKVLDKHAEEGSAVSHQPLRPAAGPSDRAPEFPIRRPGRAELSLRRLRGREVLLVFWSSRSEPSVRHVRNLARLLSDGEEQGMLVIAIGDGEDTDAVEAMAGGERLPFPVIADPHRTIARRFGIWSWPTTVLVGHDQRVVGVQIGGDDGG